jgi:hypothetical protein
MGSIHAENRGVTSGPNPGGPHGGPGTDPLPRDGQLSLGAQLSDAYGAEGRRLLAKVRAALTSGGQSINDAADALGIDGSLLTRMLSGNGANLPPRLIAYALWHDRTHDLARYLADVAGGEFRPKPPPDASFWLPKVREDLERRGLWSLVADAVGFIDKPEDAP